MARVAAGERQKGFRGVEAGFQVLQPFIQVDVGIEQQADARALALHPAEPFGVGDPLIAGHHLHRHCALRNRRCIALAEQHHAADARVVQVAPQAFINLKLPLGGAGAVVLAVNNEVHGLGLPGLLSSPLMAGL